jgi:hypothetical protein
MTQASPIPPVIDRAMTRCVRDVILITGQDYGKQRHEQRLDAPGRLDTTDFLDTLVYSDMSTGSPHLQVRPARGPAS